MISNGENPRDLLMHWKNSESEIKVRVQWVSEDSATTLSFEGFLEKGFPEDLVCVKEKPPGTAKVTFTLKEDAKMSLYQMRGVEVQYKSGAVLRLFNPL